MERVKKEDLDLRNSKSNNIAKITGAFGMFGYVCLIFTFFITIFFLIILSVSLNSDPSNSNGPNEQKYWTCVAIFAIGIIVLIAIIMVKLIIAKIPRLYFVGNEMYINQGKFYLKVSPAELDSYSLKTNASSSYTSNLGNDYSISTSWGTANLTINGKTYTLSCSSLKKAKHYLDGFKNGLSVEENHFGGDKL